MSDALARRHYETSNKEYKRRVIIQDLQDIFDESIKNCCKPWLDGDDEFSKVSPLERDGQGKYGDYICMNVLSICQKLRRKYPRFFCYIRSRYVAQAILEDAEENMMAKENKMIKKLRVRDVGYLTVELSFGWMLKRIEKMLNDANGLDSWAPSLTCKSTVVGYVTPTKGTDLHADGIRSHYIEGMVSRMLDYCGVAVAPCCIPEESRKVVDEVFTEVASRINQSTFFDGGVKASLQNVCDDLRALWSAIHKQSEVILYVIPVRKREYVEKCFNAARDVGWHLGPPNHRWCGYRTSSSEREKLLSLWYSYRSHSKSAYFVRLGEAAGYTADATFECAVRYTYLKTHRLAECTFNLDEMLHDEGNTFVYILKTRALISSLSKNSGGGSLPKYTKAFFRQERELALHLVQFTEVIETACSSLLLHPVCEYLWTLCENFTTYYFEVMRFLPLRSFKFKFYLRDATKVVMEKCFDLLGITQQESSRISSRDALSYVQNTDFGITPLPHCVVARPETLNPRIELFCMNVHVAHSDFKKGSLFGNVSLRDTHGLLSDQRLKLDRNGHGYVSYFYRNWDKTIGIGNNAYIFFGNPTPCYLAPFSSAIEIHAHLFATTLEKDKCWDICNCNVKIDLSEIAVDKPFKRAISSIKTEDGIIEIYFFALRDAIDTSMTLTLEALDKFDQEPQVSGHIFAYYGNGMLDEGEFEQDCFKAIVFKAEAGYELKVGPHALRKSVLAVPVNGELVIEALFYSESGRSWHKKSKFAAKIQGVSMFRMPFDNCCFNLTVKWNQGPKSCHGGF